MVQLEAAKELVALAHVVPDTGVEVTMSNGRVLRFSNAGTRSGPAQLTPCALRMALVNCLDEPGELLRDIDRMELSGSLTDAGAGLYRRTRAEGEAHEGGDQWCFVTSLAPPAIAEVLDDCDLALPDQAMNARVTGDSQLHVSVVSVAANHPSFDAHAHEVAQWAFARCLVEELTRPSAGSWQGAPGSSDVARPGST